MDRELKIAIGDSNHALRWVNKTIQYVFERPENDPDSVPDFVPNSVPDASLGTKTAFQEHNG